MLGKRSVQSWGSWWKKRRSGTTISAKFFRSIARRNTLDRGALVLEIKCEIDRARVVEEIFPGPKTCVFSLRYFFSAVASCSSQGGQLDNSTTVFCLTQPFCSRARQHFRFAKAYGIPGLRSPTIIWKHLCVVSATHRSQTVPDRHRP